MGKIRKGKISRKDLKEDEVKTFGLKVYLFVKSNYSFIILLVGIILVAFIALQVYKRRQLRADERANMSFLMASSFLQRGLSLTDEEERQNNFQNAIEQSEALQRYFPGHELARWALFLEGNAYYFLGEFDQAITRFNQFMERAGAPEDKARASLALGYCLENKFFYTNDTALLTQAERAYERTRELAGESYLGYEARMCLARLRELTGRFEEAVQLYEEVAEARPPKEDYLMPLSDKDKERMERLMVQLYQQIKERLGMFNYAKQAEINLERIEGRGEL